MNIYAGHRNRNERLVSRVDNSLGKGARRDEPALQVRLLGDSVRAAGQFQRSALGHIDHEHWLERLRADGQRLVDLLTQMGFSPSTDLGSDLPKPGVKHRL